MVSIDDLVTFNVSVATLLNLSGLFCKVTSIELSNDHLAICCEDKCVRVLPIKDLLDCERTSKLATNVKTKGSKQEKASKR